MTYLLMKVACPKLALTVYYINGMELYLALIMNIQFVHLRVKECIPAIQLVLYSKVLLVASSIIREIM